MGVKGRIAYIDYDRERDRYLLFVSREFNGDMAPWMRNGDKLLDCFKAIYYNKKNHRAKDYKIADIVRKMVNIFKYDYPKDNLFSVYPLEKDENDQVIIDLTPKYTGNFSFSIDYKNDFWTMYFGYSDWVYIIPICSMSDVFIKSVGGSSSSGSNEKIIALEKDTIDAFHFRTFDSSYNFIDTDEDTENGIEEGYCYCNDTTYAAPPLSTVPLRRFVEIIAQYKDGDRACLVVRDSDNKHVLFKEMK